MEKPMRRQDRGISEAEAVTLLASAEYGFLATVDEDGAPYLLPLNFVYDNGSVFFHCAYEGQKMDNLRRDGRVCFTVVGKTRVISEQFTTMYESALLRGTAKTIENEPKKQALIRLCQKYCPENLDEAGVYIEKSFHRTCVVQITIDSITGKSKR